MTKFKDSRALIGRPLKAPLSEVIMSAKPFARSLRSISKSERNKITAEVRQDNYLVLNTSMILGDKIRITKKDAIRFARWILRSYAVVLFDNRGRNDG